MNKLSGKLERGPKRALGPVIAALGLALALPAALATGDQRHRDHRFDARLRGYQEVPALSTASQGRFKAWVDPASRALHYELSYADMEGDVRQAHIHLGARGTNGGIMVWLCQSSTNVDPTGRSPTCPLRAGTVNGVIDAGGVIGPLGQGIAALEFEKVLEAMRAGAAYVNVHTSKYGPGEIRGQVRGDD